MAPPLAALERNFWRTETSTTDLLQELQGGNVDSRDCLEVKTQDSADYTNHSKCACHLPLTVSYLLDFAPTVDRVAG